MHTHAHIERFSHTTPIATTEKQVCIASQIQRVITIILQFKILNILFYNSDAVFQAFKIMKEKDAHFVKKDFSPQSNLITYIYINNLWPSKYRLQPTQSLLWVL